MTYVDPVIAKIISLLETEGPKELKGKYYFGDPMIVQKSMLPACFLTKDSTDIHAASSAEDETEMSLTLNVVFDLTKDFNQTTRVIKSNSSLWDAMEGRNDDYTLKPTALSYILRKHQILGSGAWISVRDGVRPDYGFTQETRGQGTFTVESVIRFSVIVHQLSPMLDSGVPDELYVDDTNKDLYEAAS